MSIENLRAKELELDRRMRAAWRSYCHYFEQHQEAVDELAKAERAERVRKRKETNLAAINSELQALPWDKG